MTNKIETAATILTVSDDTNWKWSIEADIPAFDGERSYKYLVWRKQQGPPPQVGAVGLGTFEAYQRSKFYVDRGDLPAGPVDGTETQYMVTWNMVAFATGAAESTSPSAKTPVRSSSSVPATSAAVYLPAPTPVERQAKELAKFRRDQLVIAYRHASDVVERLVERGEYSFNGFVEDREKFKAILKGEIDEVIEEELSTLAQERAMSVEPVEETSDVVTNIVATNAIPQIRNKSDLAEWVTAKGWSKDKIVEVLESAGYSTSGEYLMASGNTAYGLAALLSEALDW